MTAWGARENSLASLAGRGLEIGAFHSPLPVPSGVQVTYADVLPAAIARRYFAEVPTDVPIVEPEIVAPAHALPVPSGSQDFVLASHLIEHLPDPLAGLKEWHRVLRPGGLLFLAVPDQRASPDADRPRTTLEHLIADHRQGPEHPERRARDREHFQTWARTWNQLSEPRQVDFWASFLERARYPIHFHCWRPEDFPPLLAHLAAEGWAFTVDCAEARPDGYEFLCLLRKTPPRQATAGV